jgi:vanillate O-demethylase monooxygenase subunit
MKYLRNSWYCLGWSETFEDKPVGIDVMGEHLVVYRDAADEPVVLGGVCPHRFAPMEMGRVGGDTIACPYHGLVFDKSGTCTRNPHGRGIIPPQTRLRRYPAMEHNSAVWIWMGEEGTEDRSAMEVVRWLNDPNYSVIHGYVRVEANYQIILDNLLDLTHVPYLHSSSIGGNPDNSVGDKMERAVKTFPGNVVRSIYSYSMPQPLPHLVKLFGMRPGLFRAESTWHPASWLEIDTSLTPLDGAEDERLHQPSIHYLTPESEMVTHYFYAAARNRMVEDQEETEFMRASIRQAFEIEDAPVIRGCQSHMASLDLFSLRPVILETDQAAVQARRFLDKMIREEAGVQVLDAAE